MRRTIVSKNGPRFVLPVTIIALFLLTSLAEAANWKSRRSLPTPESTPQVGAINGVLYVAGGYNGGSTSNLQAFDPTLNHWTTLQAMPGPRYQGSAAVVNSHLYVVGGWTTSPPLPNNTLFVYDPPTDTWSSKATLAHLSACGVAGNIDGLLYVTTACNGFNGYTNFLDVYNPATDTWSGLTGSAVPHSNPAGGVINGKLYVAGGYEGSGATPGAVVEVYDPATNAWTTKTPMPIPVQYPASAVISGKLYVFGGSNGTTSVTTVQVYDPVKNSWVVTTPSVPLAGQGFGSDVLYGIAFVVGGNQNSTILGTNDLYFQLPSIP